MSRTGQGVIGAKPEAVAVVVTFPAGARFNWHTHADHQLAWTPSGVLTVATETARFILPPSRALWIPGGVRHETLSAGDVTMRAVYITPARCPIHWTVPTPIAVSPLIAELINHLDLPVATGGVGRHAERLLLELIEPSQVAVLDVAPPATKTARAVAEALLADPADTSTLEQWGRRVGASERTLARAFVSETGLPFSRWRTRVRLQAAVSKLSAAASVGAVANQVGYETASAFVAAFRRELGITPGSLFQQRVSAPEPSKEAVIRATRARTSG